MAALLLIYLPKTSLNVAAKLWLDAHADWA